MILPRFRCSVLKNHLIILRRTAKPNKIHTSSKVYAILSTPAHPSSALACNLFRPNYKERKHSRRFRQPRPPGGKAAWASTGCGARKLLYTIWPPRFSRHSRNPTSSSGYFWDYWDFPGATATCLHSTYLLFLSSAAWGSLCRLWRTVHTLKPPLRHLPFLALLLCMCILRVVLLSDVLGLSFLGSVIYICLILCRFV